MGKITDKNQQLNRWLARIFPPSAPEYIQPGEIDPVLRLVIPALPPSLVYERIGYGTGVTVNPGTQLFFPSTAGAEQFGSTEAGVPFGKYYWIMGARFEQGTAVSGTPGQGFIGLKHVGDVREIGLAQGRFANLLSDFIDLRGMTVNNTPALTGGGGGPVAVPPGYTVHFSTAAIPAATTVYHATIVYAVLDIGEFHP